MNLWEIGIMNDDAYYVMANDIEGALSQAMKAHPMSQIGGIQWHSNMPESGWTKGPTLGRENDFLAATPTPKD